MSQTCFPVDETCGFIKCLRLFKYGFCNNNVIARQAKEMSNLVSGIGEFSTESEVNALAARHCEDQNLVQAKINSQIDSLQETQRREYREWLMKLLEEQAEEASSITPPTPSPTHV